ncbi:MAG TPA: right-handed parallel beta-helix repeat-containing protein [Gemmatimonadales bacterium]|nr:right-handed parallel beta-helix repeat-containing protein [Gemmatimonadales bacterium]
MRPDRDPPPTGMRRRFTLAFTASLLLLTARPGQAMRACGDDVDGHGKRVPCACGDLLVSSRTLRRADRITRKRCRGTGLMIAAPGPVTLAFDGHTIRGQGQGVGVLVVRGSLSLRGPGTIEGFGTGAAARGPTALASAVGMRFAGNRAQGLAVESDGYTIQGNVAENNGRDGFALDGKGYAVDGNRATGNQRYGFYMLGMGAHVGGGLGNEAVQNAKAGFWLYGMWHQEAGATSTGNGDYGFYSMLWNASLTDIRTDDNASDGLRAMGMSIAVQGSSASGNQGFGVWVTGGTLDDRGGNSGADNAGLAGATALPPMMLRENSPALIQCRVGTMACR